MVFRANSNQTSSNLSPHNQTYGVLIYNKGSEICTSVVTIIRTNPLAKTVVGFVAFTVCGYVALKALYVFYQWLTTPKPEQNPKKPETPPSAASKTPSSGPSTTTSSSSPSLPPAPSAGNPSVGTPGSASTPPSSTPSNPTVTQPTLPHNPTPSSPPQKSEGPNTSCGISLLPPSVPPSPVSLAKITTPISPTPANSPPSTTTQNSMPPSSAQPSNLPVIIQSPASINPGTTTEKITEVARQNLTTGPILPSSQQPPKKTDTTPPVSTTTEVPSTPVLPLTTSQPAPTHSSPSSADLTASAFIGSAYMVGEQLGINPNQEDEQGYLRNLFNKYIFSQFSEAKSIKYHHIVPQIINNVGSWPTEIPVGQNEANEAWNALLGTIQKESTLEEAREHYRSFIKALEHAARVFRKQKSDPRYQYICKLCYFRYKTILFAYAEALVLYLTKDRPFPELTLQNFIRELQERSNEIKNMDDKEKIPALQLGYKKMKGYLNFQFNPLGEDNIPYVDGELSWNGINVTLLRHGVPLRHDNTQKIIGNETIEVNPSYELFLEYAAKEKQGEKVLSIILEDSDEKWLGDESQRVQARLRIADSHDNFIPMALRLDGEFFKPTNFKPINIDDLITKFKLILQEPKSGYNISRVNEALNFNFYTSLGNLINEVQALYFPEVKIIDTLQDYQAFILLSYAHITLFLCQELKISILEAICKDDIDRGNAFKTILKLHLMYLTGQMTPENLKQTLINTVFAPVLVKKQPIIKSRITLIENAVQRMLKAYGSTYRDSSKPSITLTTASPQSAPASSSASTSSLGSLSENPLSKINGKKVVNGSYKVFNQDQQSVQPRCCFAQNRVQYESYFHHSMGKNVPFSSENLIDRSSKDPDLLQDGAISFKLLSSKIGGMPGLIFAGGLIVKQNAPTELLKYLKTQKLQDQEALKILSAIQVKFIEEVTDFLKKDLDNQSLGFELEKDSTSEARFSINVEKGVAKLTWNLFFSVKNADLPRIYAVIQIADHREGKALISLSELKGT